MSELTYTPSVPIKQTVLIDSVDGLRPGSVCRLKAAGLNTHKIRKSQIVLLQKTCLICMAIGVIGENKEAYAEYHEAFIRFMLAKLPHADYVF